MHGHLLFAPGSLASQDAQTLPRCTSVPSCLRALQRDPNDIAALEQLGLKYNRQHQYTKAQAALASAAQLDSNNARIQYELGGIDAELQQPNQANAHYNLGNELDELEHHSEALDEFRRAAALKPRNVEIEFNLGNAYHRAGRYTEAARAFSMVAQLDPRDPRAQYMLGDCYVRLKQHKLALAQYQKLKGLDAELAANLSGLISETQFKQQMCSARLAIAAAMGSAFPCP
jgi:tetratricopeptide (TPR) repeat protein